MRYAAIVLSGALLAACGNLPQPFKPDDKTTQIWDGPGPKPGIWGSVAVEPIAGLPPAQAATLVDGIVEGLLAQEVPASSGAAGRGGIALVGRVGVASGNLYWTLVAPDGETVLRFVEPRPEDSWRSVTATDLDAIAGRALRRVMTALVPPARPAADAPRLAPVVLDAVRGAPGDGGPALTRAMRRALARVGIAVNDVPDGESLVIRGRVSVVSSDIATETATVGIAWEVMRPDGTPLGTVRQGNRVAAERLAGGWGRLAEAVASAGAPGIAELILRAGASARAQPGRPAAVTEAPTREAPAGRPAMLAAPIAPPVTAASAPAAAHPDAAATIDAPPARPATLAAPIALSIAVAPYAIPGAPLEAPIAPAVAVGTAIDPALAPEPPPMPVVRPARLAALEAPPLPPVTPKAQTPRAAMLRAPIALTVTVQ